MGRWILLAAILFASSHGAAQEPALPDFGEGELQPAPPEPAAEFEFGGFWDTRLGARVVGDDDQHSLSLAETRLQFELSRDFEDFSLNLTGDLLYDHLEGQREIDPEKGKGVFDLRQANIVATPHDQVDVKLGRQVLTWGTGDLVFINDLFPKDWNSFFLGRDEEYLKAPSDALKASWFTDAANIDLVYTPRFDADRFIDGRRVSYYSSTARRIVGRGGGEVSPDTPTRWFDDDEWAGRLYRNLGAYEVAGYAYRGRWKSPQGQDAATGRATFPELRVYGGSARGPVAGGIANLEVAYYDSRDDRGGANALVRNSETRFLAGYEREAARDLTLGVQWYVEWMTDHDAYLATLPAGSPARDQDRHLVTARLTYLTHNQNVEWSLFGFYAPGDRDAYLRPRVTYKASDSWTVESGGNVFFGEDDHTFLGQFRNNSNVYLALRYGF